MPQFYLECLGKVCSDMPVHLGPSTKDERVVSSAQRGADLPYYDNEEY